jgi:hypothetical protein
MLLIAALRLRLSRRRAVKLQAVSALGEKGGVIAGAALRAALRDSDYDVRYSAADALGRIGGRRAVSALVAVLHGGDGELSQRALASLGRIADPRTFDVLAEAVSPASPYRSGASVQAWPSVAAGLAAIGDARAVPLLQPHLTHGWASVRRSVVDALNALQWTPATPRDEAAAAVAMGEWDRAAACGMAAIEPLLVALRDARAVGASRRPRVRSVASGSWRSRRSGRSRPTPTRRPAARQSTRLRTAARSGPCSISSTTSGRGRWPWKPSPALAFPVSGS